MRFGAKNVNFHSWPITATIPRVTEIAKMAMMIGVTPAMSAPKTAISTMIAATTPIDSPKRRSSSETFLKSSVDVASPRM